MTIDAIIQLIVALGGIGAITGLIKLRSENKKILSDVDKVKADAAAAISGAAISLVAPQNDRVERLEARLKEADEQAEILTKRISDLRVKAEKDIDELSAKLRLANQRADQFENRYADLAHEHELLLKRVS